VTLELLLAAASCVFALVSIGLRVYRPEDLDQTLRELRRVSAELIDLDERVTTWQRRENVRRSRDSKAEKDETTPQQPAAAADRKSLLRAKLRAVKGS
jgi:hypothetical protein